MSVEVLVRSAPLLFCMLPPKIFNAKPKECITGDDDDDDCDDYDEEGKEDGGGRCDNNGDKLT